MGKVEQVKMEIFDVTGKMVYSLPLSAEKAKNLINCTAKTLTSGLYTVKITGTSRVLTEKLIIR